MTDSVETNDSDLDLRDTGSFLGETSNGNNSVSTTRATTPTTASGHARKRSIDFQPCVQGTTIAQEREYLHMIRRMALDIDDQTMLARNMRAIEFAFLYVRHDRTKRQANIARSKARARERAQRSESQQNVVE